MIISGAHMTNDLGRRQKPSGLYKLMIPQHHSPDSHGHVADIEGPTFLTFIDTGGGHLSLPTYLSSYCLIIEGRKHQL